MLNSGYAQELVSPRRRSEIPQIDTQPELVIFDCDGVLVQSEEITLSVLTALFNEQLLEQRSNHPQLSADDCIQQFRGRRVRECIEELEARFLITLPFYFEALLRVRALSVYKTELQATEGIIDLVSRLKTQFCVASSAPRSKVEQCLKLTGLWPWFEGKIFSCYELGKWKPDPLIFQVACSSHDVGPHQALVIEDSIPGVLAAVAAGIEVLGYGPLERHPELSDAGAKPFSRMSQLLDLIG